MNLTENVLTLDETAEEFTPNMDLKVLGEIDNNTRSVKMELTISDMNMTLNSKYRMGLWSLYSTGEITAKLKKISFMIDIDLTGETMGEADIVPQVIVERDKISLDKWATTISVHGSTSGWVINLIQKMFKSHILDSITSEIQSVVFNNVAGIINNKVLEYMMIF